MQPEKKAAQLVLRPSGFSLVELSVSVALVSLLALTLGFAMFRTAERSSQAKSLIKQSGIQSDIFRDMSAKIAWATEIVALSPNGITFIHPDELTGNPETTRYWKQGNDLYDKNGTQPDRIIAENIVEIFKLKADETLQEGNTVIRGIDITLTFKTYPNDPLTGYIALVNRPLKP